jgi:hypothetical protein
MSAPSQILVLVTEGRNLPGHSLRVGTCLSGHSLRMHAQESVLAIGDANCMLHTEGLALAPRSARPQQWCHPPALCSEVHSAVPGQVPLDQERRNCVGSSCAQDCHCKPPAPACQGSYNVIASKKVWSAYTNIVSPTSTTSLTRILYHQVVFRRCEPQLHDCCIRPLFEADHYQLVGTNLH